MKKICLTVFCLILVISFQSLTAQETQTLRSPNGKLQLTVQLTKEGMLSYAFKADNKQLINPSQLGYADVANSTIPSLGWTIGKSEQYSVNSVWKPDIILHGGSSYMEKHRAAWLILI